jgi:histone deacetylase 6
LFISLHRYDDGNFYPVGAQSNYNFVGIGKGKGYTINIPWNLPTGGDAEYMAAFLRVVMPVAYQVKPQFQDLYILFNIL